MDLEQMESMLLQLNQQLQALQQENQQLKATIQQNLHPQPQHPKIDLPEKFDGDKRKLRGFINQLQLAFTLNPNKYPTDAIKVAFVGSLLTGRALSWFNPMFENTEKYYPILNSWLEFKKCLVETF